MKLLHNCRVLLSACPDLERLGQIAGPSLTNSTLVLMFTTAGKDISPFTVGARELPEWLLPPNTEWHFRGVLSSDAMACLGACGNLQCFAGVSKVVEVGHPQQQPKGPPCSAMFTKVRKVLEDEKAIGANPEPCRHLAALLEHVFHEYIASADCYQAALHLDAQHAPTHNAFGLLLRNRFDDADGAKRHLEIALALEKSAEYHGNLAQLLSTNYNDQPGAREHYEQALALEPLNAVYSTALGNILMDHFEDYAAARALFESAF